MVNINFGRSKSKIVIFTKIIFAIELEFAKSAKFTARENFALYGNTIYWEIFALPNFHEFAICQISQFIFSRSHLSTRPCPNYSLTAPTIFFNHVRIADASA